MPALQFGTSSYERAEGDLPALPVINMYAEEAPTEGGGIMLQSRPGLVERSVTMGLYGVDALFQRDLVLSSALFGIADKALYRRDQRLGAIDGNGPYSMAGYENFLFAAGGAGLWGYDGASVSKIEFPDNAAVVKVLVGGGRAIAIRKDTGKFYWTPVLNRTIDALAFATAESQPDRIRDALFLDDILILFGAETVEFWPNTGDPDLPFQPLEGRVIEKGVKATGCAAAIGSTFAWVTNLNEVCLQDENTIISNPGLQARIKASNAVRLFPFVLDGMEFLALRLDNETQVWNRRTGTWSEFASYGKPNWIAQCHAGGVFGASEGGKTLEWGSAYSDLGNELERRFRGGVPIDGGGITVSNVQLRTNVGQTPRLTGEFADPKVEMRISRDAGQTWNDWRAVELGAQGEYRKKVQWRACGMASYPGFVAEWRCTAPVPFRVSGVGINEPWGGR